MMSRPQAPPSIPLGEKSKTNLAERAHLRRIEAIAKLNPKARSKKGQFFTPPTIGLFMASMFTDPPEDVRLLDAGAGVGSLTASFVEDACRRDVKPCTIHTIAYESDEALIPFLEFTLADCQRHCAHIHNYPV